MTAGRHRGGNGQAREESALLVERSDSGRSAKGKGKGEAGFALVITLIVTALLVALATEFVNEVYVDSSARQGFVDGQQAGILAESGLTGGIQLLQRSLASQESSSLADVWAKPLELADEVGTLQIVITEESGKLNLNTIFGSGGGVSSPRNHEIAGRLLKKLGISSELLDSLADWVDENDLPHAGGAESAYYGTLQPPYRARNSELKTVEELALLKGYDAKVMERLRPLITVYTDPDPDARGKININTAPREIIAALDEAMTDSLVEQVLDYRKTTPFRNPGDLGKVPGMGSIGSNVSLVISCKGTIFRIISRATVGETSRIVEAVIRVSDKSPSTVLYWREY